jgi:hypothetical protein
MKIVVMPAGMAGIQLRKDAFGDIHVSLGSSAPCWKDEMEGSAWTDRGPSTRYFQRRARSAKKEFSSKDAKTRQGSSSPPLSPFVKGG